jgi:uncharacterized protein DUF4168
MRLSTRILMRPVAAVALTAAGLLYAPMANAQAQSPSPGATEQTPNIPDQKLDATAAAMEKVATIRKDYQQRLESADAADKGKIAEEGSNALAKAVTDQGLSIDEYSAILQVARNDPAVREKLVQRLRPEPK